MHFQVLPRLLQNVLATGDEAWFASMLLKATLPSCEVGSSDLEGNAEVSAFYKQVIFLNAM
jgi:hypothetical protein